MLQKRIRKNGLFLLLFAAVAAKPTSFSYAKSAEIKKLFVERLTKSYDQADRFLEQNQIIQKKASLRGLPEGELLILNIQIPPRLNIEGEVFAEIFKGNIALSLKDFISITNFPIEFDSENRAYNGWFLREEKTFSLNLNENLVVSDGKQFNITDSIRLDGDDLYVPINLIEEWFDMQIEPDIGTQRLVLNPNVPFPATERFERREKDYSRRATKPPELPLFKDSYDWYGPPIVDISTRSNFRRDAGESFIPTHSANIRTTGEFLKGALNTNWNYNDENQITAVQANYLQESNAPELLGPLKARRFEAGDVITTASPLTGGSSPEFGTRITNADPLSGITIPSTQIQGYFFPGWDVEIYRNNSLLSFQETDQNGFYNFQNVPLLADRNVFRLIAYGPQGEVREEIISVPFDRDRLTNGGIVYDVSVTAQERQTFEDIQSDDQDRNTPHLVGFVEMPFLKNSALRLGTRARQEEGEDKIYTNAAISTSRYQALINAEIANDEDGEFAGSLTATRELGLHQVRADLAYASNEYNPGQNDVPVTTFSSSMNFDGPLGINIGDSPRYSGNIAYNENTEGTANISGFSNFNTQFNRIGFSQSLNFSDSSLDNVETNLGTTTSITGSYKQNIIRALANYDIRPDRRLDSLLLFWKRKLNQRLETQLDISRTLEDDITRYSAQVNWRPDFAAVTPRFEYNSEGDIEATLNTRFSLARVPRDGSVFISKNPLTSSGSISVFVYLDNDGNLVYDESTDEVIEGVRINAPHNSGGGTTNENGIAYISQLRPNVTTDIFIENASLPDPFWIPATEGVSVTPRTGDNIALEYPVHISGEVEGTIFTESINGSRSPAPKAVISIYNTDGKIEQSTQTGSDGYYVFSLIPPGTYFLLLEDKNLPENHARPKPKKVEIGYDGTILYEQDLILKSGKPDVPITLVSQQGSAEKDIFLNFGSYNSNLMMAIVWNNLVEEYRSVLGGSHLLTNPQDSKPNRNNKHVLKVSTSENESFLQAYKRCQIISSGGNYCALEIPVGSLL